MKRLLCQDITVEALATILANNNRGVLVARDELSGWLSSFDAYKKQGSADASQWLEMYNGGTLTVDRKTGDQRTLYVPRASVSVTGGIQPRILTGLFGDKHFENGMAARFLVAMPPRKAKRWTDQGMSDDQQAVMDGIFTRLWALSFDAENKPVVCCFDSSGKRAFQQAKRWEQAGVFEQITHDLREILRLLAGRKKLTDHLADFKQSMLARGVSKQQAFQVSSRALKVVEGCQFVAWSDITPSTVMNLFAKHLNQI